MLRSTQAQGTWLQVKSLLNLTALILKNLSVISVAGLDGNKPAQSSETWFGPPAAPKESLTPTSFEMALIEDIIVNVGEFHGQERETLAEKDGEMGGWGVGGRKDCRLGGSRALKNRAERGRARLRLRLTFQTDSCSVCTYVHTADIYAKVLLCTEFLMQIQKKSKKQQTTVASAQPSQPLYTIPTMHDGFWMVLAL